jgi:hypothetical protein
MAPFDTSSILPDEHAGYGAVGDIGELDVLHDREYRVRAFCLSADRFLVRGAVRDEKPPDLYIVDDDQPLTIHHMRIDLEVGFPSLEIMAASVRFETHPHGGCPAIIDHWAEDGEVVRTIEAGGDFETPIPIARRAAKLGLELDDHRLRFHR